MSEKHSNRDQNDIKVKSINSMALAHKNVASSEHCMTSLTSSGIGSMKSSTVSVTTGSPLPGQFMLGTLETMARPDPCTSHSTDVIVNGSSKHLEHYPGVEVESLEVKKTTVSSNSDDMFNLTDVDDVDTSGIFSISETTPIKKHKATSSQRSHEKEYKIPENILENEVVNSLRNVSSKNTCSQSLDDTEQSVPESGSGRPEGEGHGKSRVIDVKFDGDGRSIQQVQVQNSNTLNVVKRERQNSESQARRKGITK